MRRSLVLTLLVLAAQGCVVRMGRWPRAGDPELTAQGARATLISGTKQVAGELLEVRDSALVLLTTERVLLVPFTSFDRGAFDDGNEVRTLTAAVPSTQARAELQLISRYPPGMPAVALEKILAARNQTQIEVFAR